MTFSAIGPFGLTLEVAEANALDQNISNALDKRGDTITSAQTFSNTSTVVTSSGSYWTISVALSMAAGFTSASGSEWMFRSGSSWAMSGSGTFSGSVLFRSTATQTLTATATVTGATKKITTASGGRIDLGDDDWPTLGSTHTGRTQTRKFMLSVGGGTDVSRAGLWGTVAWTGGSGSCGPATSGRGAITGATAVILRVTIPRIYLMADRILTAVKIYYTPATGHGSLPTYFPKARFARRNVAGGFGPPASLVTSGYWSDSETVLGTYNAGNVRSFTIDMTTPSNVNMATIDPDTYLYDLEIVEESGGGATGLSIFHAAELVYGSIADMRFQ